MAGLFGAKGLDRSKSLDKAALSPLFAEMADRLAHTGKEQVETWFDLENGFAIGRIGQARFEPVSWPQGQTSVPASPGRQVFVEGVLHDNSARPETFLEDYARQPEEALKRLRGFFSVALTDPNARSLTIATDRHASRPVCYTVVDNVLYFAPEVKALLAIPHLSKRLNPTALALGMSAGYCEPGMTYFADIFRLRGGHRLVIAEGKITVEPYWRFHLDVAGDGSDLIALEEELGRLLGGAVKRNFSDPSRSYILLSGGTDSRAIFAAAYDAVGRDGSRVNTVTWTHEEHRANSDLVVAKQLADKFGLNHRVLMRDHGNYVQHFQKMSYILDGQSDAAARHPYEQELTRRPADEGWPCVLRGDESFGCRCSAYELSDAFDETKLGRFSQIRGLEALFLPETYRDLSEHSDAFFGNIMQTRRDQCPDDAKDEIYFEIRLQGYLNTLAYCKSLVTDHRNPLLDEEILEFMGRVPAVGRIDKQLFRRAGARAFPEVWSVPFATRDSAVDWIMELSKPTPIARFIEAQVADKESAAWEFFDQAAVAGLLNSLKSSSGRQRWDVQAKTRLRRQLRSMVRLVPPIERRLRTQYQRHYMPGDGILLERRFQDEKDKGKGSDFVDRNRANVHSPNRSFAVATTNRRTNRTWVDFYGTPSQRLDAVWRLCWQP